MRAATLLALMGVSRPIYHLIISNEATYFDCTYHINIMLLPASHVAYTVYYFTDLINNSVCLYVCLSVFASEKRDTSVQFYDDIYQKTILKYFAINCQW